MAIASKNQGKSGGPRIVYYVEVNETLIILLDIFDKSERANITVKSWKICSKMFRGAGKYTL